MIAKNSRQELAGWEVAGRFPRILLLCKVLEQNTKRVSKKTTLIANNQHSGSKITGLGSGRPGYWRGGYVNYADAPRRLVGFAKIAAVAASMNDASFIIPKQAWDLKGCMY